MGDWSNVSRRHRDIPEIVRENLDLKHEVDRLKRENRRLQAKADRLDQIERIIDGRFLHPS